MNKPTVRYHKVSSTNPQVGRITWVIPIDHPDSRLNGEYCHTSTIVAVHEGGFETINTIYIEEKHDI